MASDASKEVVKDSQASLSLKPSMQLVSDDVAELDRIDLQHQISFHLLGERIALAPLEDDKLQNVLDVATGTGLWAIQFAKEHPSANVVATELLPVIDPETPDNCRFIVEDVEGEWSFKEPFSYIHGRNILACFKDPPAFFQKSFDSLAPGGFLELQDPIMPMKYATPPPPNSAFKRWNDLAFEASEKLGSSFGHAENYANYMRQVGFVNIQERRFMLPIGTWKDDEPLTRQLGAWQLLNILGAVERFSPDKLRLLGLNEEDCMQLVADCTEELQSGALQSWNEVLVIWGQKPL